MAQDGGVVGTRGAQPADGDGGRCFDHRGQQANGRTNKAGSD